MALVIIAIDVELQSGPEIERLIAGPEYREGTVCLLSNGEVSVIQEYDEGEGFRLMGCDSAHQLNGAFKGSGGGHPKDVFRVYPRGTILSLTVKEMSAPPYPQTSGLVHRFLAKWRKADRTDAAA
jgi:hypothetical protein